jgi:hypothetical protein
MKAKDLQPFEHVKFEQLDYANVDHKRMVGIQGLSQVITDMIYVMQQQEKEIEELKMLKGLQEEIQHER